MLSFPEIGRFFADLTGYDEAIDRHDIDCVISRFAGYAALPDVNEDVHRTRYGCLGRLGLILDAEGDGASNHRLSKPADVLMLLHLPTANHVRLQLDPGGVTPITVRVEGQEATSSPGQARDFAWGPSRRGGTSDGACRHPRPARACRRSSGMSDGQPRESHTTASTRPGT